MSNDDFDSAGDTNYVDFNDYLGELILFTPTEYIASDEETGEGVNTENGLKDAVITDMDVISTGESFTDIMILQGKLIGALKRRVPVPAAFTGTDANGNRIMSEAKPGRKFLGVLAKGEPKKKGWNAPFELHAATDEQKQMARDFLAGRKVEAATAPDAAEAVTDGDDPFAVRK